MVRCAAVRRIPAEPCALLVLLLAPALPAAGGAARPAVVLISLDGTSPEAGLRDFRASQELAARRLGAPAAAGLLANTFPTT
jgi:hypothetical protein